MNDGAEIGRCCAATKSIVAIANIGIINQRRGLSKATVGASMGASVELAQGSRY
jgi:hypothetical protein